MNLPACMGGWCRVRSECIDHAATNRANVVERLCPKGEDKPMRWGRTERDQPTRFALPSQIESERIS